MARTVLLCPYCDVKSNFDSEYDGRLGIMYSCNNCGKPVCQLHAEGEPMFPRRIPKRLPEVPAPIEDDHIEAGLCYDAGAMKAAVAMCRRALQGVCVEKGAPDKVLRDQIADLHSEGLITKDLADWAQEIRVTGNSGAHPGKDGLENVTKEDAQAILSFLEEFLKYVYVMPAQIAKRRSSKP